MIDIIAKEYKGTKENPLPIGRLGENLVRRVMFDLSELRTAYGDGEWSVVAKRPYDDFPYIASNVTSELNKAIWNITEEDVGAFGQGLVELRYYPDSEDNTIYKTKMWITCIEDSLGQNLGTAAPYDDIIDDVINEANRAESAADEAEQFLKEVKNVTVELTRAEYDALSEEKKLDGTVYLITDENEIPAEYADVDLGSSMCSLTVNPCIHFGLLRLTGTITPENAGYLTIAIVPEAYRPLHETWFAATSGANGDVSFPWCIRTDGTVRVYCKSEDPISPFGSGMYVYN